MTHSLPESEFVLAKDVAGPYAGYAFFVGVGMPKSHMDTFVGNSYAAKLGFGWFSEKYGDMKRKSRGIAEWTDSITDDDAARLETEFRELARKFMKTCDALSVGNYVIDQAGEKGRLVAETGKYLDMLK